MIAVGWAPNLEPDRMGTDNRQIDGTTSLKEGGTFTDPRSCAAIVVRITFGGNIIETGTDSNRLATPTSR
jgi:hypothetical protein